uniref:Uncharacterized protein n=1 Tax=Ciona savignyi TaxID=51511 RepID=H2YMH7_CIOSA
MEELSVFQSCTPHVIDFGLFSKMVSAICQKLNPVPILQRPR